MQARPRLGFNLRDGEALGVRFVHDLHRKLHRMPEDLHQAVDNMFHRIMIVIVQKHLVEVFKCFARIRIRGWNLSGIRDLPGGGDSERHTH